MPAFERASARRQECRRGRLKARATGHENLAGINALSQVTFYQRRLPHWQPSGKPLFITWHLHGSLPHPRFPPPGAPSAGNAFVWLDRHLDAARTGPTWLAREDTAQVVADAVEFADTSLGYYKLEAFVVMPNHVHLLVQPRVAPAKFLQSVKGFSARECNKLLGRAGEPFWQSESFDHWIRDQAEFERVRLYIENNPVRAGLVVRPQDYRRSSAYAGRNAVAAG